MQADQLNRAAFAPMPAFAAKFSPEANPTECNISLKLFTGVLPGRQQQKCCS